MKNSWVIHDYHYSKELAIFRGRLARDGKNNHDSQGIISDDATRDTSGHAFECNIKKEAEN